MHADSPSPDKKSRGSILKNSNYKEVNDSHKNISTAVGQTVTFADRLPVHQVGVFRQETTEKKNNNNQNQSVYQRWHLMRDVNQVNRLYSGIMANLSICVERQPNLLQGNLKKKKQIQNLIKQNTILKEKIDREHANWVDVCTLAEYLQSTPQQLQKGLLQKFIQQYQEQQIELKQISTELSIFMGLQQKPSKNQSVQNSAIKQHQSKCKKLKKQIERQEEKIRRLEKEGKILLKGMYHNQREYIRNQRSNSALKIKIAQMQNREELIKQRSKVKINKIHYQKQNRDKSQAKINLKEGKRLIFQKFHLL